MEPIGHDCWLLSCVSGHCWQHLWGSLGFLQARHVLWDQRTEGAETPENIQNNQVRKTKWVLEFWCICVNIPTLFWQKNMWLLFDQILGVSQEPGRVPYELHEVHHQPAVSPLSVHRGVCSAGDAAFWRKVSKRTSKHPHFLSSRGPLSFLVMIVDA